MRSGGDISNCAFQIGAKRLGLTKGGYVKNGASARLNSEKRARARAAFSFARWKTTSEFPLKRRNLGFARMPGKDSLGGFPSSLPPGL